MTKKFKFSITAIYIVFIIPFMTTYLLPILQRIIVVGNKVHYNRILLEFSNWAIIIISIILVISTYFICSKMFYEIYFYMIGILVSFVSKLLPLKEYISLMQYILIVGYAAILFTLFIRLQRGKRKKI